MHDRSAIRMAFANTLLWVAWEKEERFFQSLVDASERGNHPCEVLQSLSPQGIHR